MNTYNDMSQEELFKEHEKQLKIIAIALGEIEVITDFIHDKKDDA